jgi:hypothetical protein
MHMASTGNPRGRHVPLIVFEEAEDKKEKTIHAAQKRDASPAMQTHPRLAEGTVQRIQHTIFQDQEHLGCSIMPSVLKRTANRGENAKLRFNCD